MNHRGVSFTSARGGQYYSGVNTNTVEVTIRGLPETVSTFTVPRERHLLANRIVESPTGETEHKQVAISRMYPQVGRRFSNDLRVTF